MISLKESMNELDGRQQRLRKCLRLWQGSLQAVETHMFPLFPEAGMKALEDWQQVHTWLAEDSPDEVLESAPRMVERVLHNYAMESRRRQREDVESVKAILEAMAGAAVSVRARTDAYSGKFQGVSETLGRLVQLDNPEELRRQLTQEAGNLRASVEQMVRESEASVRAMESDLRQFRARLAEAEAAASTDPLTGLANRRELEQQLETRIARKTVFCALLFDLDGFKSINDRFGHECGDQILRAFANVLNEQVRPGDVVARWGGDEFFVIFDCGMKDALRRSQQISAQLSRRYRIECNGAPVEIQVRASSGVVEHASGESAAELFRRADQAMYAAKAMAAKGRGEKQALE